MSVIVAANVWESLAPGLLLIAFVAISASVYLWRGLRHSRFRDAETASRGESVLLGMAVRQYFTWLMRPFVACLVHWAIPASAVTSLSLLLSCMGALQVAAGHFGPGGWLYLLGGACDFLDGRIARSTGSSSKAGAALDSIIDRYVESVVLLALMWHYRQDWVLIPASLALVGSLLVPYVRARGEGLGVVFPNVGIMQRPERVALLGASLVASPVVESLWPTPRVLGSHGTVVVVVLCLLGLSTQLTALQRLRHVLEQLGDGRRAGLFERAGVGRALITASLATLVDFATVAGLVEALGVTPVRATLMGAGVGAALNFSLNRAWAFRDESPYAGQATRYLFVSGSSALLNAAGVGALLLLPALEYKLAWSITRAAVFLLWNYPLQRGFVFTAQAPDSTSLESFSVAHRRPPGPHHAG